MRGASALQQVLDRTPGALTVLAVWEPVLRADAAPEPETLGRLHDKRTQQFWDPEHVVSTAMREGMRLHPTAIPLARQRMHGDENGILWDAVALFPAGVRWEATLPAPAYLDGDIVEVADELARRLSPLKP